MTIYVDVLFFLNAVINTVIIWLTSRILKREPRPLRFLLALIMCCLYGFIVCVPTLGFLLNLFVKLLFVLAVTAVCYGVKPFRAYIKACVVFFAVTACYAAILVGLGSIPSSSEYLKVNNGAIYFNLPVIYIFIAAGVLCIVQLVFCRIFDRRVPNDLLVDCRIVFDNASCNFRGLVDTGNFLREAVSGLPVVTVDKSVLKSIIRFDGGGRFSIDDTSAMRTRYRTVPYRTVGGEIGLLQGFRPDCFYVNGKEEKVIIAVNEGVVDSNGVYGGIVPPMN